MLKKKCIVCFNIPAIHVVNNIKSFVEFQGKVKFNLHS